jgi:putative Holliday junction resolvase
MALDVGKRRTGVALSDPTRLLARSLKVIRQKGKKIPAGEIADLVEEHRVGEIVFGYPFHMGGGTGEQAAYVDRYADAVADELVARNLDIEITFWDERLSTITAQQIVHDTGRRHRKQELDAIAAAVILQEYLDQQRSP